MQGICECNNRSILGMAMGRGGDGCYLLVFIPYFIYLLVTLPILSEDEKSNLIPSPMGSDIPALNKKINKFF